MRKRYTFIARVSSFLLWITIFSFSTLFISSCSEDDGPPPPTEDITQIIENQEGLDTLNAIINLKNSSGNLVFPDFAKELRRSDRTFFAPNNTAFESLKNAIGVKTISEIRVDILTDILYYHMVISTVALTVNELTGDLETELDDETISANGTKLNETTQPDPIPTVVSGDIRATNGIMHIVDNFLLPSSITDDVSATFGTLAGYISMVAGLNGMDILLDKTNLRDILGDPNANITLLAVNDQTLISAFGSTNALINADPVVAETLLRFHMLEGDPFAAQIFPSSVTTSLTNEIIYTFKLESGNIYANASTVLVDLEVTLDNGRLFLSADPSNNNIADILVPSTFRNSAKEYIDQYATDDLSIMAAIVSRIGEDEFNDLLAANAPYTLFIPNDDAFESINIDADSVAKIPVVDLVVILRNHIIENTVAFTYDLTTGTQETTVHGNILEFTEGESTISVEDTNTSTTANIVFSSLLDTGIEHDIDEVLLPMP